MLRNVKEKREHGIAGGIRSMRKRRSGISSMWRSVKDKALVILVVKFNLFGKMSVGGSVLCLWVLLLALLFSVK